jgi:peroxiredoxin
MRARIFFLLIALLVLAAACGTAKGRYDGEPIDDDDNGGGGGGTTDDDDCGDDDDNGPEIEDFTWIDADGNEIELYDYLGSVVLLDVSAFWCQPCREETPFLQTLWERFSDRDFQLIQLITEDADYNPATRQTAADWRDEFDLTYEVCADPDWSLKPYFEEDVLPFLMVLDRDFQIRLTTHLVDREILMKIIEELF